MAVAQLLAAGESVVVLDDFSTGHRDALSTEAALVEGNVLDAGLLKRVFAEHAIDTVMHFAAFIVVSESCADPGKYFENNVVGTHRLLQAMQEAGVKRFIFSSTAAVYGHPEAVPITEEAPIRPLNPYGLSKRMIEEMLEWHDKAYGLRYVVFRYFNAAGAWGRLGENHTPETHLIPNILMAAEGSQERLTRFTAMITIRPTARASAITSTSPTLPARISRPMEYLRGGGGSNIFNLGTVQRRIGAGSHRGCRRVTGREVPYTIAVRRAGDADPPDRLSGQGPPDAGLDTPAQRYRFHRPRRLELAASASERVWRVTD